MTSNLAQNSTNNLINPIYNLYKQLYEDSKNTLKKAMEFYLQEKSEKTLVACKLNAGLGSRAISWWISGLKFEEDPQKADQDEQNTKEERSEKERSGEEKSDEERSEKEKSEAERAVEESLRLKNPKEEKTLEESLGKENPIEARAVEERTKKEIRKKDNPKIVHLKLSLKSIFGNKSRINRPNNPKTNSKTNTQTNPQTNQRINQKINSKRVDLKIKPKSFLESKIKKLPIKNLDVGWKSIIAIQEKLSPENCTKSNWQTIQNKEFSNNELKIPFKNNNFLDDSFKNTLIQNTPIKKTFKNFLKNLPKYSLKDFSGNTFSNAFGNSFKGSINALLKRFDLYNLKPKVNPKPSNPIVGVSGLPKAQYTNKNYENLAKQGYSNNVIVYRCISLIAKGLASVPWLLYEDDGKGHMEEIHRHPLLDLLRCPSLYQAGSIFMESLVSQLLLSGNAYIKASYNPLGEICQLHLLRPDRVQVMSGHQGLVEAFEYRFNGAVQHYYIDPQKNSPILHLKFFHPLNDWYGISPIEVAAHSIDQHNAVAEHNLALLQNGGRPSGAFIIKHNNNSTNLNDNQREQLRSDIRQAYEGSCNAGKILMLEGDFAWQDMGLSPKDLDFVSGKNLAAREICQGFGVPPMLAGIQGDATFANYKEARFHLWEDTILPLLDFLVAEFNLWLCPQFASNFNLRLGYDLDSIPALAPRREAVWQKIANASFLTINEKREALGYTPLDPQIIMAENMGVSS